MSGISDASSAGGVASGGGGGGGTALKITMTKSGGNPILVSGSDGSSNIFSYSVSGGSPPYAVTAGADNMGPNPSGKLAQGDPSNPDGPTGTIPLIWSGFNLNEIESAYFGCSVGDSLGVFTSATIANLSVKRTS